MTATIAFSWVNYDCTSVVEKDEEDIAIIKSHAMRMVHRQRRKIPHGVQPTNKPRLKPLQLDSRNHGDPLLYRPGTNSEEVAVCRFLENFVYPEQTSPVLAFQYLHFLPHLYSKNSAQSCLTEAVTAVALACLANQNRAPADLALRARKAYANALSLVRKSMSMSETRKDDRVLTSLCLLTKYEAVTGDADVQLGQAHDKGQAALVLERDDEWLRSDVGISLFRLVYIRHLLNCVAQSQRPAIHPDEQSLELAFPAPNLHFEESCRLAQGAVKATSGLTTLMKELPAEMMYFSIANMTPSCTAAGYAPKRNNIFQDLQHASFWHVFFYGFIQALQVLLHYSSFQLNFTPEDLRKCLLKTVDDICASVPFVLNEREYDKAFLTTKSGGAVAAHYLIWLLSAAAGVPGVPDAQREWLSDRLIHIGHVHGIKDALVPAII
ncbi:hypothetical protein LTR17_002166 [Elasticomyces elasticus]|nr:hypothetical protein LTR17_002166 [Elasticomyces elasticus]